MPSEAAIRGVLKKKVFSGLKHATFIKRDSRTGVFL